VWLSVTGSSSDALAGESMNVTLCGPDAGGLRLAAGSHTVLAADGHATGWNLDELALDSAPGGGAENDVSATALVPPPTPASTPSVAVVSQTATTLHLKVSGITSTTEPFHLVLGESINSGWQATVDGGPSLGSPELIDGFANGWTVEPATVAGHVHGDTLSITLRWAPQSLVWIALVVSGGALLVVLLVSVLPAPRTRWRRRRPRGRHARGANAATATSAGTSAPSSSGASGGSARGPSVDGRVGVLGVRAGTATASVLPELASPVTDSPHQPRMVANVLTMLVTGTLVAAVTRPWIGLGVALAVGATLMVRHTRWVLTGAAIGLLIAAGMVVVVDQATQPSQPGGTWAPTFGTAAYLAWAAVACLAADAVVELVRDRADPRRPSTRGAGSREGAWPVRRVGLELGHKLAGFRPTSVRFWTKKTPLPAPPRGEVRPWPAEAPRLGARPGDPKP
jgi:hypothetical protein